MSKKRIAVVCPGRGTYTKETLGYLKKHRGLIDNDLNVFDGLRQELGEPTISEMDNAEIFKTSLHTKGENASMLIYTCSLADFLSIDKGKYEIVAITGNSMGWYSTLALAGCLDNHGCFQLINTMGSMMKSGIVGGQIIYPVTNEQWQRDHKLEASVTSLVNEVNALPECEAHISIYLGGYLVIGGNQKALTQLLKKLPPSGDYPFKLINHAAFHTPLLKETSQVAFKTIPIDIFNKPKIPIVDGRGYIWQPYSTDINQLYQYTLGHQVYGAYDFTKAVSVTLKEFCPDHLVLLGPGNTLGGSIGQIMIENKWQDIENKNDFKSKQKENEFLISMGMNKD